MSEIKITWIQRRGQIKHLLYELCLTGRIDKALLAEQFADLNKVEPVVRCKDCKYYDEIEDIDMPGYRECHYFSSWSTAHYMLPEDYCSCARTEDEVEE